MKKYKKLLISMSLISTIAIPTISMSCTNEEKKSNKDKFIDAYTNVIEKATRKTIASFEADAEASAKNEQFIANTRMSLKLQMENALIDVEANRDFTNELAQLKGLENSDYSVLDERFKQKLIKLLLTINDNSKPKNYK
ncbi:hypothetical protein ONA02_03945 [Mycoplasmopsis felis]|uniref:hypothetical protein n=1 Tax=Mycoplasmopsis felis TaxID=33923 RepID=UPI0021B04E40|nr:hypothetical protein [Mycoplasmopsis felis]UWW00950.1 hypothetical protein NW064_00550 [Mycoplasmopsis felis]WAM01809.1 hypothetical protein ONA02_03945 [Mycoplasmopsis felis]